MFLARTVLKEEEISLQEGPFQGEAQFGDSWLAGGWMEVARMWEEGTLASGCCRGTGRRPGKGAADRMASEAREEREIGDGDWPEVGWWPEESAKGWLRAQGSRPSWKVRAAEEMQGCSQGGGV